MDDATVPPDPFDPLRAEERRSAADVGPTDTEVWEPIIPARGEPPEAPQIQHSKHGRAAARWIYRDAGGAPLFAVVRFNLPNGDKEVLPYTFGRRVWMTKKGIRRDVTGWHFKRPNLPVPLYGLDRLAARPDAPVLVCEGEKVADAASLLFPDMVCIASEGGSSAAHTADWTPLVGHPVTGWPDHDAAGSRYAEAVVRLLGEVGTGPVRVVSVPQDWPDGWDLADPLPDGVTTAQLSLMLAEAQSLDDVKLPSGFVMRQSGLHFIPDATDTNSAVFIAAHSRSLGKLTTVLATLGDWCCGGVIATDGRTIGVVQSGLRMGKATRSHPSWRMLV